jgi:hypothetical protein
MENKIVLCTTLFNYENVLYIFVPYILMLVIWDVDMYMMYLFIKL